MPQEPKLEYPSPEDARPPEETWRVLFLDTEEHNKLFKAACKAKGYTVVGAHDMKEAWLFLEGKDHVDVIVCGAHLERGSVFEFLTAVRRNEVHRNSAFIILSLEPSPIAARMEGSTASAAMALGADGYWQMETFDPDKLVEIIEEMRPAVPLLQRA
jgi:CheY-like chemotaxis protein